MKKIDVVALGELLIDMTDNGQSAQGNTLFEANPGGAPCNVLAMLRRFQHSVSFIGKVGDDIFGHRLKSILDELGIGSSNLCIDKEYRTTLAFVETLPGGDRDFSFYRNPGADAMLRQSDVDEALLRDTRILHFGTLSMTHSEALAATKYAVETAKKNGALISFDPNIREPLWDSLEDARVQVRYGLSKCDILKISDNEIQWFTKEEDYTEGVKKILKEYPISLILVSMGKEGSRAYIQTASKELLMIEQAAYIREDTIETTGAGDTFMGCVLHTVLEKGLPNLIHHSGGLAVTKQELQEMLRQANAAASIITSRRGALRVMPTMRDIEEMLANSR